MRSRLVPLVLLVAGFAAAGPLSAQEYDVTGVVVDTQGEPLSGAMVVAPLLGPNVALALGLCLADTALTRAAIRTNLAGFALAFGAAFVLGVLFSVDPAIPEMASRTRVGLLDLVLPYFEKWGFFSRDEIRQSYLWKRSHVYPVYDTGYKENVAAIRDYLYASYLFDEARIEPA